MNKSRSEFSSRNKSFNSNGSKTKQKHGKYWKKNKASITSASSTPPGLAKTKNINKNDYTPNGVGGQSKQQTDNSKSKKKKNPAVIVENGKPFEKSNVNGKIKKNKKSSNVQNCIDIANPDHSQKHSPKKATSKRKSQQDIAGIKKPKLPRSESDSDAEDYIDRFFHDVTVDTEELPEETSSTGEDLSSESDSEENVGDDGMPFEELLKYYGHYLDKKVTGTGPSKTKKVGKVNCSKNPKSAFTNGWIEEDNDVGLVYEDSDDGQDDQCKALVPVDDSLETSDDDFDYRPSDSAGEEDEEDDDDYEELSDELEDDSLSEEYSDCEGYSFEADDHFVSDSDDYDSEDDDEDDEFSSLDDDDEEEEDQSYWDDSYNSEDDEDYEPSEDDDDLFIGRGTARIYEIDDNNVSFNSDIDSAQIVELPLEGRKYSVTTSATESQSDNEADNNGDLCPELVPIYDTHGRLIENTDMLNVESKHQVKSPKKSNNCELASDPCSSQLEGMQSDDDDQAFASEAAISGQLNTNDNASRDFRFYDSIDMRMSLILLKNPIYFSGSLTVQPLIGSVEVMGYHLKRGECRSAFAARGFNSLNLTPYPAGTDFTKQNMDEVQQRLATHFLNADLKEIAEILDPAESVLVLLQADCNNQRIEVVEKYLPEEVIFPKVELLKRGEFFTTEYLLNAEFYTEHVFKSTALYTNDPQWDNIEIGQNSKILVMGGKTSGKSTLCQTLINKSIASFKKVVLIDLDIGQPIQHVPESISVTVVNRPLLGVATFDPIAPEKCWLFGSLDVVSSPIFYVQNVRRLVRYCQEHKAELANIPWIVNTMGYVTGFGEELMAAVIRMLNPTDVVEIRNENKSLPIPNFQNTLNSSFISQYNFKVLQAEMQDFCQRKTVNYRHHLLNVCYSQKGFTLNAPKRRNLMLLSHLANILNDSSSEWFNEVRPFCAPLSKLQVLITRDDQTVADDQLPSVLNATLVYLCRKTDNNLYECLGIGIVRGVDKNNNVYLLQSLSPELLAEVTVLAICSSSLPNTIFLQQSARVQGSIPYVYNVV
ncbi:polynucleotide 5'-hydroxyl-kinase NOL9 [Malaya genurostris]|uniref:polynucleotide 5'-hydroxyl-kinase NOL9 n=1 Tax=Malaya genurostris TaxID=325434 RepID=UPI0026F3EB94|nr:polynucleotide 5'-hydroxyl-kinase NOL9 [Malaya genurostris]